MSLLIRQDALHVSIIQRLEPRRQGQLKNVKSQSVIIRFVYIHLSNMFISELARTSIPTPHLHPPHPHRYPQ
jgi:hypothetical protein